MLSRSIENTWLICKACEYKKNVILHKSIIIGAAYTISFSKIGRFGNLFNVNKVMFLTPLAGLL